LQRPLAAGTGASARRDGTTPRVAIDININHNRNLYYSYRGWWIGNKECNKENWWHGGREERRHGEEGDCSSFEERRNALARNSERANGFKSETSDNEITRAPINARRDNGLRETASSVISPNEKAEFRVAAGAPNNPDYRSAS